MSGVLGVAGIAGLCVLEIGDWGDAIRKSRTIISAPWRLGDEK
jgi:hypothetical protein